MSTFVHRRHRPVLTHMLIVGALALVSVWRLWPAVDTVRFHRDEARWIGNAALLREWRNPLGAKWQDEGYPGDYGDGFQLIRRRDQPPLTMYLLGASLVLQGEGLPSIGHWSMTHDETWNAEQGNMPSASELRAARRTNVAVTMLTVFGLYLLVTQLAGRLGGAVAGALYALHPLVQITSVRAWADPLLVLCIVLTALVAHRFAVRPAWRWAVLLGVAFGLGTATKLSPFPVAVGLGALGIALWAGGRVAPTTIPPHMRRIGRMLAVVPAISVLTFIALYPYLWPNPVSHLYRMYAYRAASFEEQAQSAPASAVPTRSDALRRIGHELGDRFSTSRVLVEELEGGLGRPLWASLDHADLVIAVLGLLLLAAMVVQRGLVSPVALVAAVIGGQVALIVLTMRVEWARYLLPVVLLVAMLVGVVAGVTWDWLSRQIETRRTSVMAPEHSVAGAPS